MNKVSNPQEAAPKLIGLDWGTTRLRAYLLADGARMLQERTLPLGVMNVGLKRQSLAYKGEAFEAALEEACGDWMWGFPSLPILAAGMVGSDQGWQEAPYLPIPLELSQIGRSLTSVTHSSGRFIQIVPGLLQRAALPDVMRGEETQVFGALASCDSPDREREILFGLPGTHSKWVYVSQGRVHRFATFMTGEVFAALCEHTILGRTMRRGAPDTESFDRGVKVSASSDGRLGVLSNAFSVRTLGLTRALSPEGQAEYFSGLLIGHEVSSVLEAFSPNMIQTDNGALLLMLVGETSLCARYARALEICGHKKVRNVFGAAQRGLWEIARKASLVKSELM